MNRRTLVAVLALVSAALACNLPGSNPTPAATPAAAPTSSSPTTEPPPAGPQPTSAASITETPLAEETPPLPSDPLTVLETKVASGEWTHQQGLIFGLQSLVGEATFRETFGETVETEGTGIVLEAQRYLLEGQDAAARAEIERLLSILQVDPARLDEYSQPEPEVSSTGPAVKPDAALLDPAGDCAALWADGFPTGVQIQCFLYKQQFLGSYESRIYYPSWWAPAGVEWAYAQAAHEALADAYAVYSNYGQVRAINLVFTILPLAQDPGTLAMVPPAEVGTETCLILVYPNAIKTDQGNASSTPYGVFKQTIAHELFHCFQGFNFPDKFPGSSWSVHAWWGESTAEYFSNLVYPSVNYEWRWRSLYDALALFNSVFDMSYENFGFFQYLGNRLGNQAVIALISALPAGNDVGAQHLALAGYPDISAIYHDYGLAYLEQQIIDTSGAPIPFQLTGSIPTQALGTTPSATAALSVPTFSLGVRQVVFLENQIYDVNLTWNQPDAERSARLVEATAGWLDDLPTEVIAGCGVVAYRVLLTSIGQTPATHITTVTADVREEIGCDKCLIGSWELNETSMVNHLESLMSNTPDFGVNFVEGSWEYTFGPNGDFTGKFTDFLMNYTFVTDNGMGGQLFTDVEFSIDGESSGYYYVDNGGNLVMHSPSGSGVAMNQKVWMDGDLIQDDPVQGGGLVQPVETSVAIYTCSDAILSIRTAPWDVPQNTPVDYDRVSP